MDKRKFNGKSERAKVAYVDRRKIKDSPEFVYSLYQQGMGMPEIAQHYGGISVATVCVFFKKHGLQARSKTEIQTERMKCPKIREHLRKCSVDAYLTRRKFSTGPELHFEEWLNRKNIRFITQYRKIGNKHPYDFFLPDYNLIVEIDGHYWHSKPEQKKKDIIQTKEAIAKGYFVVRIDTLQLQTKSYEEFLGDYIEFECIV